MSTVLSIFSSLPDHWLITAISGYEISILPWRVWSYHWSLQRKICHCFWNSKSKIWSALHCAKWVNLCRLAGTECLFWKEIKCLDCELFKAHKKLQSKTSNKPLHEYFVWRRYFDLKVRTNLVAEILCIVLFRGVVTFEMSHMYIKVVVEIPKFFPLRFIEVLWSTLKLWSEM